MNNKVENKDPSTQRESFTELLGKLAANAAEVFHDEIELVIQGIHEKVRVVRSGVLTVATGAVHQFCRIPVSLRCIDHRTHLLHGPRHCGACDRSGACFNRCRHCLHRLQEIEEINYHKKQCEHLKGVQGMTEREHPSKHKGSGYRAQ